MARTAVLIPALNEEEALPAVLRALPRDRLLAVVVVDNGSTDRTAAVARAEGAVVVAEAERGYGAACLAGIARLSALDPLPEAVVFLDADHPESAEGIPLLLGALSRGADLALGVRAGPRGETGNLRAHARWGNRLVLACARLLFGRRFRDLPPFRAVGFPVLDRLAMDDRSWGWTLQMQLRAARLGLSVAEVEVPHRPRSQGRSKISGRLGASLRVGAKMAATLLRERVSAPREGPRRPGPPAPPPSPGGR